jgi:hypothetical protein
MKPATRLFVVLLVLLMGSPKPLLAGPPVQGSPEEQGLTYVYDFLEAGGDLTYATTEDTGLPVVTLTGELAATLSAESVLISIEGPYPDAPDVARCGLPGLVTGLEEAWAASWGQPVDVYFGWRSQGDLDLQFRWVYPRHCAVVRLYTDIPDRNRAMETITPIVEELHRGMVEAGLAGDMPAPSPRATPTPPPVESPAPSLPQHASPAPAETPPPRPSAAGGDPEPADEATGVALPARGGLPAGLLVAGALGLLVAGLLGGLAAVVLTSRRQPPVVPSAVPPAPSSPTDQDLTLVSAVAAAPAAPVHWRLVIVQGAGAGQAYRLGQEANLGRGKDNQIRLEDNQASRRHALIRRQAEAYLISDLASSNGTFVNGARIRVPVQLCPGDTIKIGATLLEVTLEVSTE